MNQHTPEPDDNQPDTQRRIRRFSIFLILGVVAVVAVGLWVFSSWFSSHYYDNAKPLDDLAQPSSSSSNPPSGEPG